MPVITTRFFLISMAVTLCIATWVALDAKKRGYSVGVVVGWFMGVFFVLILFLPLYFILRSRPRFRTEENQPTRVCTYCGKLFKGNPKFCPYCGEKFDRL